MRRRMSIQDLWTAVRERDQRYQAERQRRGGRHRGDRELPDRSPNFIVELKDHNGHVHTGEIICALVAVQEVKTNTRHRTYPRQNHTSCLVPDGFKINTVGGTVVFNMSGMAETTTSDHKGVRLANLALRMTTYPKVDVQVVGNLTLDRMSDEELAWAVRDASKHEPELKEKLEEILNQRRDYFE